MKKFFLLVSLVVLSHLGANAKLGIDRWNWWLSTVEDSQGHMPYYFCSDFGKVKGGFNACTATVYEASVKFGELTPESKPFLRFDILLNDKGKIIWYEKEIWSSSPDGYFNSHNYEQCFLSYDETTGKLLSETYTTRPTSAGDKEINRKVVYKYDTSNRLVMIDCYKGSGNTIQWKTKFVYGNGYVDRYEYYSSGELACKTRDTMDAKGRFWKYTTKQSGYNGATRSTTETVTYNEKGVVAKIDGRYTEVVNGRSSTSTLIRKYDYRYDSNGNWTDRVMSWNGGFMGDEYEWVHCEYYKK